MSTARVKNANSLWALGSEVARAITAVGVTLGLTQVLTQSELGIFSAVTSVATTIAFLAYLGAPHAAMRRISRANDTPELWPMMLGTVLIGSTVGLGILAISQPILFGDVPVLWFLLFAATRLYTVGVVEACVSVAGAHRDQKYAVRLRLVHAVARFAPFAGFALGLSSTLGNFAILLFAGSVISAMIAVWMTGRNYRYQTGLRPPDGEFVREGVPLGIKLGTASLLDSADRPVLLWAGLSAEAGIYSVGYRIASLAQLPVMALVRSTAPDFFEEGAKGPAAAMALAKKLTPIALVMGLFAGAATWLGAGLIPVVLGSEWSESADVVRWLALVPALKAVQYFASNALTGSDQPMTQVAALVTAAVLNLVLNVVLVPTHGINGALGATLGAEMLYAGMLWVLLVRAVKRS